MGLFGRLWHRWARGKEKNKKQVKELVNRALREYSQQHGTRVRSLNTVVLRFSTARLGFQSLQQAFTDADTGKTGTLTLEETKRALKSLQWDLSDNTVESIFKQADVRGSYDVDLKEFALFATLAVLLAKTEPRSNASELEEAIAIAVDTFLFFDQDGSGTIKKDEVAQAMCSSPHNPRHPHTMSLGELRFDEMDWDRDGVIDFTRFMYSFTDWVGLNDEEAFDREDEEHRAAQLAAKEERRRSVERRSIDTATLQTEHGRRTANASIPGDSTSRSGNRTTAKSHRSSSLDVSPSAKRGDQPSHPKGVKLHDRLRSQQLDLASVEESALMKSESSAGVPNSSTKSSAQHA